MKRTGRNILKILLFTPIVIAFFHPSWRGFSENSKLSLNTPLLPGVKDTIRDDTTRLKYPFRDYKDPAQKGNHTSPMYLKNPSNVQTTVDYDPITGEYVISEKIGDLEIRSSNPMNSSEYTDYSRSGSISDYWIEQRKQAIKSNNSNESFLEKYLNPKLNVNIKGFDKVFGSNVIDIKPQGSAELIFGVNISKIENPTLPINLQRSTTFDFEMKIQMGVTGKIGDKMKVGINYNTEAQFDFENQTNISYTGDEDEIIQSIEAGNVSLPLTGTLITGSQSLFGLKTALQFGKLKVTSIFSQQKSESSVIQVEGGAQTSDYQLKVDEYESNKHFFLSHYFADNYDKALQNLPVINSGITITDIEVWVTNKSQNFENSRNILALMDLAENDQNIYSTDYVSQTGPGEYPYNEINNLFEKINGITGVRNINEISTVMPPELLPVIDYAKIENARPLSANEYTLNAKLGYISLNSPLNDDEVLAVAYQYTVGGKTYTVGEFSNRGINPPDVLILKLIKGPALQPKIPTWDLMMKNVYSIGSYQINSEDFKLDIFYNDDKTGTTVNYIDAGAIAGKPLLKVMGLDQLNSQLDPYPDGYFDFVDKQTINAATGRIIFPVKEPFGKHLRDKINDEIVADKYVFEELYDSSQSKARQIAEKNKFIIKGSYKSAGGAEINLNAFNIPEGSVKATANGIELAEGVDYIVDYNLGKVTILNQGLLQAGTPIRISLENNSMFNINRKTLLGTHLDYIFSDNFALGGTILHLSEKPLTNKVNIGSEPISNTIWGIDGSYSTDVPFLTRLIDALPFLETKESSTIEVSGEFANLIPGHSKTIGKNGNAYIDDFEGTKTSIDLKAQYTWAIASTPKGQPQPEMFPEGDSINKLVNGFNRAKIAWYNVNTDLLRNTSVTPDHITVDDQSNHFVREVPEKEIFPNKESITGYPTVLNVANIAFYPDEKGPYNYDVNGVPGISEGIDENGKLIDPKTRWGGIMRELQTNDFEASNIEYIEFWLMDPFVYEKNHTGGDLYFNLGYISEDILKDGRKSFENGLPTSTSSNLVDTTTWGLVPIQQSLVNAFDNDPNSRSYQDVGMDGLSDEQERTFFGSYLNSILTRFNPDSKAYTSANEDPSSDDYHFFRGSDYDRDGVSILDRYKKFNGLEGNSPTASQSPEPYPTSATLLPDIEDINLDNTLNEEETYFQYKVSLRPEDSIVGQNYITDKITPKVKLKNGEETRVNWYQFKIPIRKPDTKIGPISDFKSIRFMRMFLKNFDDTIILRLARLDLVRSEWRTYEGNITEGNEDIGIPQPSDDDGFDISVVSIEENGNRQPVNYVLPPGVSRVVDPTNPYLRQLNEQSISFKVTNLNDGEAKTAYKNIDIDIRQYKKLQMEVHLEKIDQYDNLKDNDLTAFIRLGSDYRQNYYEIEKPLKWTPYGSYDDQVDEDRRLVWPEENKFNFELELLQLVKQHRNNKMNEPGSTVQYSTAYVEYIDGLKITVVGDPNLSNLKTVMLGVRNPSKQNNKFSDDDGFPKSGIIWFNELRVTDFIENGGWAATSNMTAKLADFGSITIAGNKSTHGFGSIDQKINERQKEDITSYDIQSNLELGKFFPQKTRVRIPLFLGFSENIKTPQYNPLDPDILMQTSLNDPELSNSQRSELERVALDYSQRKSFNITNMKIEGDAQRLEGKKKRFYHISNFSTSFAFSEIYGRNIKTEYNDQRNYAGSFAYTYNNKPKPWEPFNKMKIFQKKTFQIIKEANLYLAPYMLSFRTDIVRRYQETKTRDITQENAVILPTFKKDFDWNRIYDVKYSITKALKFEFNANNKSRIDEPYGSMDKNDQYYRYKRDTLWQNFLKLGRNTKYNHTFNATYNIPINKLPFLRWTSAQAMYKSTYEWSAAPLTTNRNSSIGNIISNSNAIQLNGTLTFSRLYDKIPFLKEINDKMKTGAKTQKKYKDVQFTKEKVNLKKDIPKSITHNLATEDVQIKVLDTAGKEIKGELIIVNQNKVKFKANGNYPNTLVEVNGKREIKENFLRKLGEGTVYALMGLKNASISYSEINGTILPGYLPSTKYFGLSEPNNVYAPGFPFVLGIQDEEFPKYAAANHWITSDTLQTAPYVMNATVNYSVRATAEPLRGLKIDITASKRQSSNKNEYWFPDDRNVFSAHNIMFNGGFSMTYIMLNTTFMKFGANYSSEAYDRFKANRIIIANRLANQRVSSMIPGVSPDYDPSQPNIDPETGLPTNDGFPNGYGPSSQEVLIPSLLAAYSGGSPEKVTLSPFPKFPLPNWSVTYDGLSELDLVKRVAKNISLTHIYTSSYSLGSYNTNPNYSWTDISADGMSWAREVNGMFIPAQDANSISIIEEFKPLISADVTWINNFNSKIEINRSRSITMSFSNSQIIDLSDKALIIGLGYRFEKLPIVIKTQQGAKQKKFESDLNLRGDLSIIDMLTIIRKIEEVGNDQITAGQKAFSLKLSADYALNERFNLKLFYDHAITSPRISTSFRTSNVKFGVSVRFTLIP